MRLVLVLLITLSLLGCERPMVAQGTVQSYREAERILVIKDEQAPNAELQFSLEGAEIGSELKPGDVVRIAYREESGTLRASRVMNVTRQK